MIPKQAIEIVKSFEGYKDKSYICPAGLWSVGYGHTKNVKQGQTTTLKQANQWLEEDLETAYRAIKKLVKVPLNQNQLSALISFVYNVGVGNFFKSTLLQQLNKGYYDQVPYELSRWDKVKGVSLGGLTRRRRAEAELFNKPIG